MNEQSTKKNNRTLIISITFVVFAIGLLFLINYVQTKNLLKNGVRANAMVTARYYEVSDKGDTSSYSMRMKVVKDTANKNGFYFGEVLNAYVKKESFDKYEEGAFVKVVYKNDDLDHAKLLEEIE
ncbi:MAG: hypothetical protein IPF58_12630 [Saprospirales bacterium]|nr:hypothetical protein [Saprospirales bacterium]